jgi:hypothetical protein
MKTIVKITQIVLILLISINVYAQEYKVKSAFTFKNECSSCPFTNKNELEIAKDVRIFIQPLAVSILHNDRNQNETFKFLESIKQEENKNTSYSLFSVQSINDGFVTNVMILDDLKTNSRSLLMWFDNTVIAYNLIK